MVNPDQDFKKLLGSHSFEDLEAHAGAIYGVWADFRLAYMNPGWYRFAKRNGGEPQISAEWGIGRSILDSVTDQVKAFYETNFKACLNSQTVWKHEYACPSPLVYRRFHQIVYPLGKGEGLLIVNSLLIEEPHDPELGQANTAATENYAGKNGFVSQCAFCRRVRNFCEPERWDWVPDWVERPPEHTSHTFCPACFRHYYAASHSKA